MAPLGKIQDGEEEELIIPEALLKDNRKGNTWLLYLCVRLTCVCFWYLIFILLSVLNAILIIISYLFHNSDDSR